PRRDRRRWLPGRLSYSASIGSLAASLPRVPVPLVEQVGLSGGREGRVPVFRDAVGSQVYGGTLGDGGRGSQCPGAFVADLVARQVEVLQAGQGGPAGQLSGGLVVEVVERETKYAQARQAGRPGQRLDTLEADAVGTEAQPGETVQAGP